MNRIYYMVLYDIAKPKGANGAMKKIIDEHEASVLLQEANATIHTDRGKFTVVEKRIFDFVHAMPNDKTQNTLMIVCDVKKDL